MFALFRRCVNLGDFDGPRLRHLAEGLLDTALCGKAPSTTKKYLGSFRRWNNWAADYSLPVLPAKEAHIVLYLEYLGESKGSFASIKEAVNALPWVHSLSGLPSCSSCSLPIHFCWFSYF